MGSEDIGVDDETSSHDGDPRPSPDAADRTQGDDDDARDGLQAGFASALDDTRHGFETRHHKNLVAAALFGEPIESSKIGRFSIVRELGAGGMGVVYVAFDEQLDRKVAVKLLRGAKSSSDARRRLEREAQAMARLSHPNVVAVHDVGDFEGQLFVAMEFVEGQDLRGWLKAERRGVRAIVEVFCQAGEGLAAAHAAGIVHRDFKPDNVLVGADGRVRVADFGLAHAFDAAASVDTSEVEASGSHRSLDIALTRTGAIMGTPAYMPPEQYAGQRTDARSDQFSFCVALWEGLYGKRPFSGHTVPALCRAISDGRIDPPPVDSEVPAWLSEVVRRGLSPEPDARWPSMRALLDAISRDPIARRRRLLARFGLGGASLALIAGLTWISAAELRNSARARYWTHLTEQLLEIERERGLRQANDDAQRARDATRMSVVRRFRPQGPRLDHDDPTAAAVLLREVEGAARWGSEWISSANETLGATISHAVLEGHRDALSSLLFSGDGAWLYSAALDGEVWRWRVDHGVGERLHGHHKPVTALALSPDGRWLASSSHDGSVRLTALDDPSRSFAVVTGSDPIMSVAIDPRGRWLAFGSKGGRAELHELSGEAVVRLTDAGWGVYGLGFDDAGERLLTTLHDGTAKLWRVADGRLLSTAGGHTAGVFHGRILDARQFVTASDDGTLRLHELDASGAGATSRVLARHDAAITALDVHGDKAVTAGTDGSMIVSSFVPGREPVVLPAHADGTWDVVFTPDGEQVASASFDGTARLTRADGRGVPRSFVGHRTSVFAAAVDRSGRWLATGSYDTTVRLWALDRPPLATPLRGHTGTVFTVEPDASGERVVSASHDGTVRIWAARDGTALAATGSSALPFVNHASFSPRGDIVAIGRGEGRGDDVAELWYVDDDRREVLRGHSSGVWRVAFDAGGQRVATASFDNTARIWDTASGAELLVLRHADKVTAVDFSPRGDRLVTASHDETVRIWATDTGELRATLDADGGKITNLLRSPDGHTLATACDDGSVRLWADEQPEHVRVLAGHDKQVWSIAFDATGERLLTGSFDGRANVWDVADGALLHSLVGHADAVWDAAFVDDRRVITAANDGTVRLWTLDDETAPIVLSSAGAAGLTSITVLPNGRAVAAANDGSLTLWRIDQLSADPDVLLDRLARATIHCLAIDERMRELGEDRREAEQAARACLERRERL